MAGNESSLLAVETAYYEGHARELLLTHPNRFLLIHGDKLVGTYGSHSEAVAEGVRRYGRGPFLVRRTGDEAIAATVPALTLGQRIALATSYRLSSLAITVGASGRRLDAGQETYYVHMDCPGPGGLQHRHCLCQHSAMVGGLVAVSEERTVMAANELATRRQPGAGGTSVSLGRW